MTRSLVGGLVVLIVVLLVLRMMISGRGFSPRRAFLRAKSGSSANALLMLAAVNLACLGYELAEIASKTKLQPQTISLIVVACILASLYLLVARHSIGESLIGVMGFGAALTAAGLHYGSSGVAAILVMAVLVLWVLGLMRGFAR